MVNPFFHRLGNILWAGLVILLVALAIYVSVGRLLAANVAGWRTEILRALNARGPFVVEAEHIRGEWQSFSPVLVFSGLRLGIPGSAEPPLQLSGGRVAVDVLNSLRTGTLNLTHIVLEDLSLHGELTAEGVLHLEGLGLEGGESGGRLRDFLLNVEMVTLRKNRLLLTTPDGDVRSMGLDLTLSREGSFRQVDAHLTSTRGADISLLAEGTGDPFNPGLFSGRVYADIKTTDIGAVKDLFGDRSLPAWADGAVNIQLWFDWDRGGASMQFQLQGHDLLVASREPSWQLPLDRLSLQARLDRDGDKWQLFIADLQAESSESSFRVPRVQLGVGGDGLEVRAADVQLAPAIALVTGTEVVSPGLRDALVALEPRGRLSQLQISIADLDRPEDSWGIAANFEQLAVDSFKGAPGARSVSGFARMAPGGGTVLLDSRDVALEFPQVFRQPLEFGELYGNLDFHWDDAGVRLHSGLLTTEGAEGRARVLFGLNIPRAPKDTGIEMDLLVGLQDSHPKHRVKYLPYGLNPGLLAWLEESIGEGVVEQGAFLWRGSLKKDAGPLRTIQMAFNVSDTHLTYHPQWPPLVVREGIVLFDDAEVSVWAERADLFESTVESLSVETRMNGKKQVMLAVDGKVTGPAADGLKVLNQSPLTDIVGMAFKDWILAGDLETDLQLRLNLGDRSAPPRVEVATRWRGVDLTIPPWNLEVKGIDGWLDYSTTGGFSSRSLRGSLWGNAVEATLAQHHRPEARGYDPATTVVEVELAAEVAMRDVVDWLKLDLLEFASGRAAMDIGIHLTPGEPPLLTARSDLRGVSLDFPAPWRKGPEEERPLQLEMPLAADRRALTVKVGEDLGLALAIADGGVRGGALGINVEPPTAGDGFLRVTGHSPLVQGDEWMDFAAKYLTPGARSRAATAGAGGPPPAAAEAGDLGIRIEDLRAETLVLLGREFEDAGLNLEVTPAMLNFALDTGWLRAGLTVPREGGTYVLDVEHLDLDRLPAFSAGDDWQEPGGDLPRIDVTLGNLFQSDRRLGDLAFELSGGGNVLTAERISGELAHLRLSPEHPARLVWHRGPEEFTELQARVRFGNLGETLEFLGYERIVETARGSLDLDLNWPGAPQRFALAGARGSVAVDIGAGSFLDASSGTEGALRVVSILNLADIVQRLSLAQMFESGIPFDSVKGEVYLHGGAIEVAYMDVAGGSSFHFSGVSEIESRSLGGELVATLPVANNLPWIAALAASLPVAAGVFVVSQVFNKQVKRLSSAVYSIGGTWDDPDVKFDHIYDGKGKKAIGKSGGVDTGGLKEVPTAGSDVLPDRGKNRSNH